MKNNIVLAFIFLSICFISCVSEKEAIELKIQATDTTNQPRENLTVEILKVKNPIFSMRSFVLIHTLRTDEKGFVQCKISKKGDYSVRFYRDNGVTPFYWVDTLKVKDLNGDKFFKLSW